ncbi:MAG: hypothetical protein H6741_27480 [Alphaproteobacteria bacterium]|nr:hypothetical protein [Alphaproteobacteria bacterium]MCB9796455.1 hypothetical protein [Alphaproteobacteria bacterium]
MSESPAQKDKLLEVHCLDVGQGDCTLVIFPEENSKRRTLLVDCGSSRDSSVAIKAARQYLMDRLGEINTTHIDDLVLTHPDKDHYNLLDRVVFYTNSPLTVGTCWYTGDLSEYTVAKTGKKLAQWVQAKKIGVLKPFDTEHLGTGLFSPLTTKAIKTRLLAANMTDAPQVLRPKKRKKNDAGAWFASATTSKKKAPSRSKDEKNRLSAVLMLSYGPVSVLLMGDADHTLESWILQNVKDSGVDFMDGVFRIVLRLGHHGSRKSTSKEWLEKVTPRWAFVSAGGSSFKGTRHPERETLERLNQTFLIRLEDKHYYCDFKRKKSSVGRLHKTDYGVFTTLVWEPESKKGAIGSHCVYYVGPDTEDYYSQTLSPEQIKALDDAYDDQEDG